MQEISQRSADGTFAPGHSGNPAGRQSTGYQALADRIAHWWTTKSIGEVERVVRNKTEWRKLSGIDTAVCRRILEAEKKTGIHDMRILLEYLVGRPMQPVSAEFKVTHGLADRIEKAITLLDNPIPLETNKEPAKLPKTNSQPLKSDNGAELDKGH